MIENQCVEGRCTNPVVVRRDDGRCYYHGKVYDGLTERTPRRASERSRDFLDVGGGRIVEIPPS
ncbi:MAG: hypothetical protein ACXVP3_10035 [Actinomycetota bacterium]